MNNYFEVDLKCLNCGNTWSESVEKGHIVEIDNKNHGLNVMKECFHNTWKRSVKCPSCKTLSNKKKNFD